MLHFTRSHQRDTTHLRSSRVPQYSAQSSADAQSQHVSSHFLAFLASLHVFFAFLLLFVFVEHQSVPFLSSHAVAGGGGGGGMVTLLLPPQ